MKVNSGTMDIKTIEPQEPAKEEVSDETPLIEPIIKQEESPEIIKESVTPTTPTPSNPSLETTTSKSTSSKSTTDKTRQKNK